MYVSSLSVSLENTNTLFDTANSKQQLGMYIWSYMIIFFAAKDGEALYSQQKQDWELTVAQIMNPLLPNSDLNWIK